MQESTGALPAPPPGPKGIIASSLMLFGSLGRHFHGLLTLAGLEGREAAGLYVRMAIFLGAALFFAAFGYVFFILFAAFAVEWFFAVRWVWIMLGLTVFHVLAGLFCIFYVKRNSRTPVFKATSAEIRKDFDALRRSEK